MSVLKSQQDERPINVAKLVAILKAIVPRSFEKTFEGISTEQVVHAMRLCTEDLSKQQINTGLTQVRDHGFCPDPALFRKWCIGSYDQNTFSHSFKGKHAALANILKWLQSSKHTITNAEKRAYNRCYELFNAINYACSPEQATYFAYAAFKENYQDVVKTMLKEGEVETIWQRPNLIEKKTQPKLNRLKQYTAEEALHAKKVAQYHLGQLKTQIRL